MQKCKGWPVSIWVDLGWIYFGPSDRDRAAQGGWARGAAAVRRRSCAPTAEQCRTSPKRRFPGPFRLVIGSGSEGAQRRARPGVLGARGALAWHAVAPGGVARPRTRQRAIARRSEGKQGVKRAWEGALPLRNAQEACRGEERRCRGSTAASRRFQAWQVGGTWGEAAWTAP